VRQSEHNTWPTAAVKHSKYAPCSAVCVSECVCVCDNNGGGGGGGGCFGSRSGERQTHPRLADTWPLGVEQKDNVAKRRMLCVSETVWRLTGWGGVVGWVRLCHEHARAREACQQGQSPAQANSGGARERELTWWVAT
jgi:hypothetical protein